MNKLRFFVQLCFLLCANISMVASAAEIKVAVASNFYEPMRELAQQFEQSSEHSIIISSASSAKLFSQIRMGAPFDILLSADEDKIDRLVMLELANETSTLLYAQGQLALYSNKPQYFPVQIQQINEPNITLAYANPDLAPYGLAAQSLFDSGKWQLKRPPIMGENISQVFHFVHSRSVDFGLVAYSHIRSKLYGDDNQDISQQYVIIPSELHPPILQKAAILKRSKQLAAAEEFMAFLQGEMATDIISEFGYLRP